MDNLITRAYDLLVKEFFMAWDTLVTLLPNLIVAVLVLILAFKLARVLSRFARRMVLRLSISRTLQSAFAGFVYYLVIAFGLFIALDVLDLNRLVVSLLAGAGVVGLALSFAFQDLATNFISGIFIAFQKPFNVGDWVETNGFSGYIEEIGLRSIKLRTEDGQDVIIPSKEIFQNPLKNYFSTPERLITLNIGISYHSNMREVQETVKVAVSQVHGVDSDREILVVYNQFSPVAIDCWVKFWIKTSDHTDFLKAQSDAIIAVNESLLAAGIVMPAAMRGLVRTTDGDDDDE